MNRLLIVDGSNLLFQMFFGMPARIVNERGKAIHGTLGFVGALLKIMRKTEPTHVVALFDGEHENERSALDADYKANRVDYSKVGEDESPFSQLSDVYAALDYLGVKHTETTVFETDDVIAAYALTYGKDNEIVVSSFDSDFFQLVTENVSVFRYRGDKSVVCTPAYVKEKFGVSPCVYADFKSLVGDPSDNIRGAEKVGPKTAAALLNEFGSLENLISNAEYISKPSARDSIVSGAEKLATNYKIIKLDGSAPLPFKLDELEYEFRGLTTTEVLKAIGLR